MKMIVKILYGDSIGLNKETIIKATLIEVERDVFDVKEMYIVDMSGGETWVKISKDKIIKITIDDEIVYSVEPKRL